VASARINRSCLRGMSSGRIGMGELHCVLS
jgi:hypothetical protein